MSRKSSRPNSVRIEAMESRLMLDASQLTESIVNNTLPVSVSDLSALKGKVSVNVVNNSGVVQKNKVHVVIVGTTDPVLDLFSQADKQLGVVTSQISLTNGQSKTFKVSVNVKKSALPDATYTIYALVLDPAQTTSVSAANGTLTVRPPIVQLAEAESFAKLPTAVLPGAKFNITDKITITNTGSDASTEPLAIAVYATTDGIPADGTLIAAEVKKATINPNKSSIVQFKLSTFPSVALGTYKLITQVTTARGAISTSDPTTAPTISVGSSPGGGGGGGGGGILFTEKLVSVKPNLVYDFSRAGDHVDPLTVKLIVKNSGTAISEGNITFTLFASNNSTFDDTAVQEDTQASSPRIPPRASHAFTLNFTNIPNYANDQYNTLQFYVFIQVTDPSLGTSVVAWPTQVTFAD